MFFLNGSHDTATCCSKLMIITTFEQPARQKSHLPIQKHRFMGSSRNLSWPFCHNLLNHKKTSEAAWTSEVRKKRPSKKAV